MKGTRTTKNQVIDMLNNASTSSRSDFSYALGEARRILSMTETEMAEALGVGKVIARRWLANRSTPNNKRDVYNKLCAYIGRN